MRERLHAENRQPLFSLAFSGERFPKGHGNEHRKVERDRPAFNKAELDPTDLVWFRYGLALEAALVAFLIGLP